MEPITKLKDLRDGIATFLSGSGSGSGSGSSSSDSISGGGGGDFSSTASAGASGICVSSGHVSGSSGMY